MVSMDGSPGRVFPKILPDAVTILLLTLKRPLAFREFAELTRDQRTVHGVCDAVRTCVSGLCYDRGRKEKKDGRDNHPPTPLPCVSVIRTVIFYIFLSRASRLEATLIRCCSLMILVCFCVCRHTGYPVLRLRSFLHWWL